MNKSKKEQLIKAADMEFCDALKDLLCDKVQAGGLIELTDAEDKKLMSLRNKVVRIARRSGGENP